MKEWMHFANLPPKSRRDSQKAAKQQGDLKVSQLCHVSPVLGRISPILSHSNLDQAELAL
jgi:hypothetical protein